MRGVRVGGAARAGPHRTLPVPCVHACQCICANVCVNACVCVMHVCASVSVYENEHVCVSVCVCVCNCSHVALGQPRSAGALVACGDMETSGLPRSGDVAAVCCRELWRDRWAQSRVGWRGSGSTLRWAEAVGAGEGSPEGRAAPPVASRGIVGLSRRLARADFGSSVLAAPPVTGDGAVCIC